MLEQLLDRVFPGSAWHRHYDVRCRDCRVIVHKRATCAKHSLFWQPVAAWMCWVPRTTTCNACIAKIRARA